MKTGWTLEYIDGLSVSDVGDYITVVDIEAQMANRKKKNTPHDA